MINLLYLNIYTLDTYANNKNNVRNSKKTQVNEMVKLNLNSCRLYTNTQEEKDNVNPEVFNNGNMALIKLYDEVLTKDLDLIKSSGAYNLITSNYDIPIFFAAKKNTLAKLQLSDVEYQFQIDYWSKIKHDNKRLLLLIHIINFGAKRRAYEDVYNKLKEEINKEEIKELYESTIKGRELIIEKCSHFYKNNRTVVIIPKGSILGGRFKILRKMDIRYAFDYYDDLFFEINKVVNALVDNLYNTDYLMLNEEISFLYGRLSSFLKTYNYKITDAWEKVPEIINDRTLYRILLKDARFILYPVNCKYFLTGMPFDFTPFSFTIRHPKRK